MNDSPSLNYGELGLQVGMIGCGNIAGFHAEVLKFLGITITSVCGSPNSLRVAAFADKHGIEKRYGTWQEMVTKEKLDALWVVAKWDNIDSMLLPLLEYGIPIMFEKPVALSTEKLSEAIDHFGHMMVKTQVGYNRRFYDFMPCVKEILSTQTIKAIEIHLPESTTGVEDEKLVNHLFLQNSSHVIDLLLYLLDFPTISPLEIKRHIDSKGRRADGYNGLLMMNDSIPIHLIASWNSPSNFCLKFHSDGSLVELLPIETARVYNGFEVIEPTRENPIRRYKPQVSQEFFLDPLSVQFKPGFLKQTQNFVEACILGTRPNIHGADLHSTLKVTDLCLRVMKVHS
jgi:predicted dehydrogenase